MTKFLLRLTSSLSIFLLFGLSHPELAGAQTAGPSIIVDFATQESGVRSMSGFLHGMSATKPADTLLRPLQPKFWRGRDLAPYDRLNGMGTQVELVVSDTWGYPFQKWTPPYENYPKWENHIRKLARDSKGKRIIWDIWNEPNGGIPPFWKGTRAQLFQTYERAYRVLREELGPTVMIGGPSVADYDRDYIIAFLEYCRAHRVEVNFLSWHELMKADEDIPSITNHLWDARRNMVNNPRYKNLNIQEIRINEAVGLKNQYRPGDIVGYLYYLEKGRADAANKTCWPSSKNSEDCIGSLDGLIDPNTEQPRAAWWIYKSYADGFEARVKSKLTDLRIVSLASRAQTNQQAQVLVGHLERPKFPSKSRSIRLILKNLKDSGASIQNQKVQWTLHKVPNTEEKEVGELPVFLAGKTTFQNGDGEIILPPLDVHEAFLIKLDSP
jgi:xylan 1,4-beta-xylosidase